MLNREDIANDSKWDLSVLYSSQSEWESSLKKIAQLADTLAQLKGKITVSASNLYNALCYMDELGMEVERAASYARMSFDVDMSNSSNKQNYERIDNLLTKIGTKLSFYDPELLTIGENEFKSFLNEEPSLEIYTFMFEKLFMQKEHILSTSEEEILTCMGSLGSSFRKIFDDLTINDIRFPIIKNEKNEDTLVSESDYRKALSSYDREYRRSYFKGLLGTYGAHINSITSAAYGNLKYRSYVANARKYSSARKMSLENNHVPEQVYDTLVATVRANANNLQRYFAFRKTLLGYKSLHFYDLFVPLVPNIERNYTFEEAKSIVLDALSILGNDYRLTLERAFSERWIDVYPNNKKVSGAYANGVYGYHPYALLNFSGTLEDLFTMAHELGHVMHSYYSNLSQPYINSDYVIFTAEVTSTVNEYLLYRYLLEKTSSPKEEAYLLSMHLDNVRSTLYRQTFFADFESQMHQMVADDIPVTPDKLCETYRNTYEIYHGIDFEFDDELLYEWARIPHFYNSFYVYQYATGISAAIALAKRIISGKPDALDNYLDFISKGGSDFPIKLLQQAGVDMSTPLPVEEALADFSETLAKLEKLL